MTTDVCDQYNINEYKSFHVCREGKRGGGVAIYIKSNLKCKKIHEMSNIEEDLPEQVSVEISLSDNKRIALLRPSPSDRCMDYHLLSWKTKITASERGAPPGKEKGLI